MRSGKQAQNKRRDAADVRDKAREARTDQEQLDLVKERPGASRRETERLEKRLAKGGRKK